MNRASPLKTGTIPGTIYVDADACPVKQEIYRVAERHGWTVQVVANDIIALPVHPLIKRVVVGDGFDAADDWIAERAGRGDIVVTADVPLASRCVKAGAEVLAHNGKGFSDRSIGMALASRNLMAELREAGQITGGPRPFSQRDRSAFLSALHETILRIGRTAR
ncbi:YaiI/YqxD family protein [Pelagibius sp.]|uniref:YaiI/YqxD family protein n=1 Tax=Pelagibius sp. TaxID=1931238 RepID=UPI00262CCDA9|nr:YaiI/YqxD family protein [Pelagibius sp.]